MDVKRCIDVIDEDPDFRCLDMDCCCHDDDDFMEESHNETLANVLEKRTKDGFLVTSMGTRRLV